MITGEIKLYDEPIHQTSTYYYGQPRHITQEEKAKWEALCESELEKAKCIFQIGDKISSINNPSSQLTITEFIENIADMQRYQGMPCVVRARNLQYPSASGMQYALCEFNMSTHKGVILQEPEQEENQNDE